MTDMAHPLTPGAAARVERRPEPLARVLLAAAGTVVVLVAAWWLCATLPGLIAGMK